MELKKENGISLIILVVTIMVLGIIATIILNGGKEVLKKAELEEIRTNMLLIQAKCRGYVEQATFRMGINPDDNKKTEVREAVYVQEAGLEKAGTVPSEFGITDANLCYWFTTTAQNNWGLDQIKLKQNERYLIQFNEEEETVEIYNTIGFNNKYSLTEINKIEQ